MSDRLLITKRELEKLFNKQSYSSFIISKLFAVIVVIIILVTAAIIFILCIISIGIYYVSEYAETLIKKGLTWLN